MQGCLVILLPRRITLGGFATRSYLHQDFVFGSSRGRNRNLDSRFGIRNHLLNILRPQSRLGWPLQQMRRRLVCRATPQAFQGMPYGTEPAWLP